MSMQVRPRNADALARALREETAILEDLERIERGLRAGLRARTAPSRGRSWLPLGLAVGALAAASFWLVRPVDDVTPAPVAVIDSARPGQVLDVPLPALTRLGNADLTVGAASTLRIDEIDVTRAVVTLARGEVRVAFHPEHRGEEHLAVLTPAARVDVVGTEFTVSIGQNGGTHVVVLEGVVRVTPTSGEAATSVRAGESIDVAIAVAVIDVEEIEDRVEAEPPAVVAEGERHPRPAVPATVVPPPSGPAGVQSQIRALEAEASDHAARGEHAAVIEIDTRILALDPHGADGANALWERAEMRERFGDPARARADYERYLAEHPSAPFAATAQQRIERLSAFPSAP